MKERWDVSEYIEGFKFFGENEEENQNKLLFLDKI